LQANDIDIRAEEVEFALIEAKKIGKNACELVDENRFKGAIADLIHEVSGTVVEGNEEEWDIMFYDMVSVAAGEFYGPDIFTPGAVTPDMLEALNRDVDMLISYGLREEYIERSRGPAYKFHWSNGLAEWYVAFSRLKAGTTVRLDANEFIGYGKKADLEEAAKQLNPLPLYTGSFEYKERKYPMKEGEMTWQEALLAARRWAETKNPAALVYINSLLSGEVEKRAEEYGKMGFPGTDRQSAIRTQLLYVLNNLSGWRGEEARAAKVVLRSVASGDTPARQEDPSEEETRRRLQQLVNAAALEREEIERFLASEGKDTQIWDTRELQADFEVMGFLAPFVAVRRKSDGQVGSLLFQHAPRYYWDFTPDTPSHYTDDEMAHLKRDQYDDALEIHRETHHLAQLLAEYASAAGQEARERELGLPRRKGGRGTKRRKRSPSKIVGITKAGMDYWDKDPKRRTTQRRQEIRSGSTDAEHELWLLGLMYGAPPEETDELHPLFMRRYGRHVDSLIAKGYLREFPRRADPSRDNVNIDPYIFLPLYWGARDRGEELFIYEGREWLVAYARYVVEAAGWADVTPEELSRGDDYPGPSHYTAETPQGALESMEDRLTADQQFTRRMLLERLEQAVIGVPQPVAEPVAEPEPEPVPVEEAPLTGRARGIVMANAIRDHIINLGELGVAEEENPRSVAAALRERFPDITERDVSNALRELRKTMGDATPKLGRSPTVRTPKAPPPVRRGKATGPRSLAVQAYVLSIREDLADKTSVDIANALRDDWPGITPGNVGSALTDKFLADHNLPKLRDARLVVPPPPPLVIETGEAADVPPGTSLLDRLRQHEKPERQTRNGDSWSRKYFFTLTEAEHDANDAWFEGMLRLLKDDGILGVPTLQKAFNKRGEEVPFPGTNNPPNRLIQTGGLYGI
jgi:hypothetical protein